MKENLKIAIVGGGAAGFFSAINLKEFLPHSEVVIFEKSTKVLSKVKVSGGGRCNVTHACFDPNELIDFYPRGKKELRGPFHQFMSGDTIEWFAKRGVELKIEEDGRMFPISDNSQDVIDCFLKECDQNNIKIELKTEITSIQILDGKLILNFDQRKNEAFDKVIIASGGNSKLAAYQWISNLGHHIIPPIASLFTFNLEKNNPINQLMGLSVPHAIVNLGDSSFISEGPLLITHWGLSGPAILKLSSVAATFLHKKSYQFEFEVNWIGDLDFDDLISLMNTYRSNHPKRNVLKHKFVSLPNRLWEYFVELANLRSTANWADLSKKEMEDLAKLLNAQKFKANGKTTFKEEFVSCGGVDNKEIDFKTMQSKLIPNLYFAGEVLNIDALTGGFNFQSAWTTGYIAAKAISEA